MKNRDLFILGALGVGAYLFIVKPIQQTGQALVEAPLIPIKAGAAVVENIGTGWNAGVSFIGEQAQAFSENLVRSVAQAGESLANVPINAAQTAAQAVPLIPLAVTQPLTAAAALISQQVGNVIGATFPVEPSLTTPAPVQPAPATTHTAAQIQQAQDYLLGQTTAQEIAQSVSPYFSIPTTTASTRIIQTSPTGTQYYSDPVKQQSIIVSNPAPTQQNTTNVISTAHQTSTSSTTTQLTRANPVTGAPQVFIGSTATGGVWRNI